MKSNVTTREKSPMRLKRRLKLNLVRLYLSKNIRQRIFFYLKKQIPMLVIPVFPQNTGITSIVTFAGISRRGIISETGIGNTSIKLLMQNIDQSKSTP